MEKTKAMLKIYLSDPGVAVHAALAVAGLAVAATLPTGLAAALVIGGWCSYVVQEHLVHRFVFHAPAPQSQFLFNLLYRMHYGHHDQARNRHLLFTPIWCSLGIGVINVAVVAVFLPLPETLVFVWGGGVCAYLLFEWIHLLSHFNSRQHGRYARYITRRHAKHHFLDHTLWFTVSPGGALVDSLLMANPNDAVRVRNVRTCGLETNDHRLLEARRKYGSDDSLQHRAEPALAAN